MQILEVPYAQKNSLEDGTVRVKVPLYKDDILNLPKCRVDRQALYRLISTWIWKAQFRWTIVHGAARAYTNNLANPDLAVRLNLAHYSRHASIRSEKAAATLGLECFECKA